MALNFPNAPTDGQVHTENGEDFVWVAAHSTWRRLITGIPGEQGPEGPAGPEGPQGPTNPLTGYKNQLINGAFDVWQRGTGASSQGEYSADRWRLRAASGIGFNQATNTLSGSPYMGSLFGNAAIEQRIENHWQFIEGEQWTLSAKADVAFTFEHYWHNGTGGLELITPDVNGFASWTFTVREAPGGQQWFGIAITASGGDLNIADIQLEKGDTATQFERRPLGLEQALCYRYFHRSNGPVSNLSHYYGTGGGTHYKGITHRFPVPMRAIPGFITVTPASYTNCTSNNNQIDKVEYHQRVTITSSGKYRSYGGTMDFDAEL